ncbi:putative PRELI domain containing protein 3B [Iris pallida]|uniref:PRELI domain containing protein 3B n=1 Tax=Iris pallida TaxID=29817 RepID=A0AAX6EJM6_IRIPA|nr:putative PRELI domain containing protein 3B [Iris pallida]
MGPRHRRLLPQVHRPRLPLHPHARRRRPHPLPPRGPRPRLPPRQPLHHGPLPPAPLPPPPRRRRRLPPLPLRRVHRRRPLREVHGGRHHQLQPPLPHRGRGALLLPPRPLQPRRPDALPPGDEDPLQAALGPRRRRREGGAALRGEVPPELRQGEGGDRADLQLHREGRIRRRRCRRRHSLIDEEKRLGFLDAVVSVKFYSIEQIVIGSAKLLNF